MMNFSGAGPRLRVVFLALPLFLGAVSIAVAQENTGKILGTVTDISGSVVPDARITATSPTLPTAGIPNREFNKMDGFVFRRVQRWQDRRLDNGRHGRSLGPLISFMEWVCIGCKARCAIRRKSFNQDIVKLCAGKRHAQFERGLYGDGPALNAGTAP